MKVKFLKLKSWLVVSLMGALGLTGCHCHRHLAEPVVEEDVPPIPEPVRPPDTLSVQEREPMKLMYGVPTMDFVVRGQVKDAKGRPVRAIRVNLLEGGMEVQDGQLVGDTERVREWLDGTSVETDAEGRFEVQNSGYPQKMVKLAVRDVDGKANGEYKDSVIEVKVEDEDVDRTNAYGFYNGTFRKELDVKLENK